MGSRIRATVLAILISTGCWGCVEAMMMSSFSNMHVGFDGKVYKTPAEADQTFQKALSEVPERGKSLADRALLVLPSATAIGLYQMKFQDKMMAQMHGMSPGFGGDGGKAAQSAMEKSGEMMKAHLERYHAFFAEALKKRRAFKHLVLEKSDRPGLVQRPEYDVNILLVLKDSGQEEWVVRTSLLNASTVPMAKPMAVAGKSTPAGGSAWLIKWLEDLESQAEVLLKRQERAALAK